MAVSPLRFLHSSDFRLDTIPVGIGEVPEALAKKLIDAPLKAAERVFETAILEEVDFIALAGKIINPTKASAREIMFLLEQLETVHEHGITVYWSAHPSDCLEAWPTSIRLPDNVHLFSSEKLEQVAHFRAGEVVATILGQSAHSGASIGSDFYTKNTNNITVAITAGKPDVSSLTDSKVAYWALGGQTKRETLSDSASVAHYSGTIQGRHPSENGPCGCTLVSIGTTQKVQTEFISTDDVRFLNEQLFLSEENTLADIEHSAIAQLEQLRSEASGLPLIVTWQLTQTENSATAMRTALQSDQFLARLQQQFGKGTSPVWSDSITPNVVSNETKSTFDEDTILGDFLRELTDFQQHNKTSLDLSALIPAAYRSGELATIATTTDDQQIHNILRDAADLGANLLSGDAA
ncbi:MAG: hypothetical protein MK165_04510 [Pirellulaceae bacterium]|nr:hypothetical protein [Pirellulaceae bacterium]